MNLIETIKTIDAEIEVISLRNGFSRQELKSNVNALSIQERVIVLGLLKKKLRLQKKVFENDGGDLSNVIFLSAYR